MLPSTSLEKRNRKQLFPNISSAELFLDTSPTRLYDTNSNDTNTNITKGAINSSQKYQKTFKVSKASPSPFSKSTDSCNAIVNDLKIRKHVYRRSNKHIHHYLRGNEAYRGSLFKNNNSPRFRNNTNSAHKISDDERENFINLSENIPPSEERRQQQKNIHSRRHHPRKALSPLQDRRNLSNSQMEKHCNPDNELRHQLRNCAIVAQTMKPILSCDSPISSSVEIELSEDDSCYGSLENTLNSKSSCISSLSVDESSYQFPDSSPAQTNNNVRNRNNCSNLCQMMKGETGENNSNHHLSDLKQLSQTLLPKRGVNIPDEVTFSSSTKALTFSAESSIDKRKSHIVIGNEKLQNHIDKVIDIRAVDTRRHSYNHSQNDAMTSLENERPRIYHQRNISSFITPTRNQFRNKSNLRKYDHDQSPDINPCTIDDSCNEGSAFKTCSSTINQRCSTMFLPRRRPSFHPPILHRGTQSACSSPLLLDATTISLSHYGAHTQDIHENTPGHDRPLGGESSITSASDSSIIINGRLVKSIKRRRQNLSPMMGGPGAMIDDRSHRRAVSLTDSLDCESAIKRKVSRLEMSTSFVDSQSLNAHLSFESIRKKFKDFPIPTEDDVAIKNLGVTDSSMNDIATMPSRNTNHGQRRRRRRTKDEIKFLVGQLVPRPIKVVTSVLTKTKSYDLERSRQGCLT